MYKDLHAGVQDDECVNHRSEDQAVLYH